MSQGVFLNPCLKQTVKDGMSLLLPLSAVNFFPHFHNSFPMINKEEMHSSNPLMLIIATPVTSFYIWKKVLQEQNGNYCRKSRNAYT